MKVQAISVCGHQGWAFWEAPVSDVSCQSTNFYFRMVYNNRETLKFASLNVAKLRWLSERKEGETGRWDECKRDDGGRRELEPAQRLGWAPRSVGRGACSNGGWCGISLPMHYITHRMGGQEWPPRLLAQLLCFPDYKSPKPPWASSQSSKGLLSASLRQLGIQKELSVQTPWASKGL